jgi:TP53 regulating kinase and related kinases
LTESTSPGVSEDPPGELLYRGAEADVIRGEWQGLDAVYKIRKPLRYRLPVLDREIRRQRTLHEAEMVHQAKKAGVPAPYLYFVDPKASTLVMEYVNGTRLKDLVDSGVDDLGGVFREFGRHVGVLHKGGIMHGDLTTANVVRRGRTLVFIDFGLSIRTERVEDHAVDLRLIKETLAGAHPSAAVAAMESLSKGYAEVLGPSRSRSVLRQLLSIERRGRYARVA